MVAQHKYVVKCDLGHTVDFQNILSTHSEFTELKRKEREMFFSIRCTETPKVAFVRIFTATAFALALLLAVRSPASAAPDPGAKPLVWMS